MTLRPTSLPSPMALFRYQVVSEIRARVLAGTTVAQAIREIRELPHYGPDGRAKAVTQRSAYRWLAAYADCGLEGLEAQPRPRVKDSAVLRPAFLNFLQAEKERDPHVSVPELIERAQEYRILADDERVSRCTVWRACQRLGLPLRRAHQLRDQDMRRFAYPHRMLMVLCDGKHFRAGRNRLKRVAMCLLDDASRYGLGGWVGTSESTELFLLALYEALRYRGLMKALYLDNGSGFISEDTRQVIARLGIHLIYGTRRYPEGHGKIEKFNQTSKGRVLRGWDGNPEIDPDPAALTLRFNHWLREVYNHKPHESLDGQTPAERWNNDSRTLELPEPAWLQARFSLSCERKVSNDNVINMDGIAYEMPRGYARTVVRITRHLLDGRLSLCHHGRQIFLQPVPLEANAYSRREKPPSPEQTPPSTAPTTAADLRYQADFDPLVDPDGSFPKGDDDE